MFCCVFVDCKQARSQDLEKGGGGVFWKSEKCANDLDPNFHCSWISYTRFVRKLRWNFSESSKIQRFFPTKIKWSPKKKKKKKGLHRFWDWFFGRDRKFQRFFRLKSGGLQKKRNKDFTGFETDFSAQIGNPNVWGGGAVFNFSLQIGLKTSKMVRFCILHKPMGGLEPPRPLLATLLIVSYNFSIFSSSFFRLIQQR